MKNLLKFFGFIILLIFGLLLFIFLTDKLGSISHNFFGDTPQSYSDREMDGLWRWSEIHNVYFIGQVLLGAAYIAFSIAVVCTKYEEYW